MRPLAIPFRGRILGYPMVLRPASATQTPLLLDLVTGAAAAYSLRKLRNAYAGSAVRVRRSSDNSEQDIGFSGTDFDTSAFSSFIGGGSGYVATWYDQSSNGKNATQATAAKQPLIVLNQVNGRAIVRFSRAASQALNLTSATLAAMTFFNVMKSADTVNCYYFGFGSGSYAAIQGYTAGKYEFYSSPRTVIGNISTSVFQNIYTAVGNATNALGWSLGSNSDSGQWWSGDMAEAIVYPSALSAGDQSTVAANILTWFGV